MNSSMFPRQKVYLIRHGQTAWTLTGQHTGMTDIDLTPTGEQQALALSAHLKDHQFKKILCSPMKRAIHTCELANLFTHAEIDHKLTEWNYGNYEGLTTPQIWEKDPGWAVFSHGAPGGESICQVQTRAAVLLKEVKNVSGDVALFSHGHFLRVFLTTWLGLSANQGSLFALSPGSISILGYERTTPVLLLWNWTATTHAESASTYGF